MTTKTTKTRRLTEKQVAKLLADYDLPRRVTAYLATLGSLVWRRPAALPMTPWEQRISHGGAALRDIVVLTRIGTLGISLYDDWIACVFDDADAGAQVGASRPSGKWNHHAFVGYCHKPTDRLVVYRKLNDLFHGFITSMERITLERPLMEVCGEMLIDAAAQEEAL